MINTKATVTNVSLQMYDLNTEELVNRFHNQMVDHLKYHNLMSGGAFKEELSISRDLKYLDIGGWDVNTIGIKPARLIKQGNRTISDFADDILRSYVKYLKAQEKRLSQLNHRQICQLLDHDEQRKVLFSSKAYTDWTIENLEQLDKDDINMNYILDENQNINTLDYFIENLIIKLPNCNTIDGSTISLIASTIAFQYKIRLNSGRILSAALSILSNQLQNLVKDSVSLNKINNLYALDYNSLCQLFTLTNINNIKLPLISILNISPFNISDTTKFQLYVNSREDLQSFINNLCNVKTSDYFHMKSKLLKILQHSQILFYFDDYQIILQNQINALKNNFTQVDAMIKLADLLTVILNQS